MSRPPAGRHHDAVVALLADLRDVSERKKRHRAEFNAVHRRAPIGARHQARSVRAHHNGRLVTVACPARQRSSPGRTVWDSNSPVGQQHLDAVGDGRLCDVCYRTDPIRATEIRTAQHCREETWSCDVDLAGCQGRNSQLAGHGRLTRRRRQVAARARVTSSLLMRGRQRVRKL
jgi:hypothetical protein